MRRDTPVPLYPPIHILDDPSSFPELHGYLIDGLPLNQKKKEQSNVLLAEMLTFEKKNIYEKINDSEG